MSCTFWLRRIRLAAQKQKAEKLAAEKAVEVTAQEKAVKKPAKKAVQKNDSTAD
jgi:hypothetical protein